MRTPSVQIGRNVAVGGRDQPPWSRPPTASGRWRRTMARAAPGMSLSGRLGERRTHRLLLSVPGEDDGHLVTDAGGLDDPDQVIRVVDGLAVHRLDDVALLDAGLRGGAVRCDRANQSPATLGL